MLLLTALDPTGRLFHRRTILWSLILTAAAGALSICAESVLLAEESPKMTEIVRHEEQLSNGAKAILILSDSEKYSVAGRSNLWGRLSEIRLVIADGAERSDRAIFRRFTPGPPYEPPNKVCRDVTIDRTTREVYLCTGVGDAFSIFAIQPTAVARIAIPRTRVLSLKEFESLMSTPVALDGRDGRRIATSPKTLSNKGISIERVGIEKHSSNLRVSLTTSDSRKQQPAIVMTYALDKKQWLQGEEGDLRGGSM